ncbi:AAA family ATPase [Occultella kanbiaonis]|uniref:AAA family ATPase n=1 Tax=Occultella kanbiaonis TaxID=2675754 RepID=UPI0012B6E325|nr:AAA family ATPase [Occultella kanbiaonis]
MLTTLAVQGYRSLRDVVVPLGRLTLITGANGSGKSSLYRSLRLLTDAARGGAVAALAREGGLPSTLWAGPETISGSMRRGEVPVQGTRRTGPVRLQLGFAGDGFGYAMDLGLPRPDVGSGAFALDPEIKVETVWSGPVARPAAVLAHRRGPVVRVRDGRSWSELTRSLADYDSMLGHVADPHRAPELLELREQLRGWRFYDHLRTDAAAPARLAPVGTRTPVLAHDGADLAAALATIQEIGRSAMLVRTVDAAFPGSRIEVSVDSGRFSLALRQDGMLRPMRADELSDGTLRYLMLTAALLTPRPPELLVLNEPETSLHPELIGPLAGLIHAASEEMQVVVVTHSGALQASLADLAGEELERVELVKELGETTIAGQGMLSRPSWTWPSR